MKRLYRIILWVALVGIAFLAGMSIIGAFMGDERASLMFNSSAMTVFWVLLGAVFVAGLLSFRRLRTSPGLLALHLGCLLILVGSMVGSATGHRAANGLLGRAKVPFGRMVIPENAESNQVLPFDGSDEIGRLPFSIRLKDFAIEYYPAEDANWLLMVEAAPFEKDGAMVERPPKRVAWVVGEETMIPYTDARLKVLQYLPGSRPTYSEDVEPALEITRADGETTRVPAEVGREVVLEDPQVKLRIAQVFSNLRVEGTGSERRVIDVPGLSDNPALKIEIENPDGTLTYRYVMPNFPEHGQEKGRVNLRYVVRGEATGAEVDPESSLPAMEVLLKHGETEAPRWLIARKGASHVSLSLAGLIGEADSAEHAEIADPDDCCADHDDQNNHASAPAILYLVKPVGQIRDYKSDLVVLEEGREVARKTIEVNDPLHYGGYHFYQHSYDQEHGRYTVLSVRSDSGLLAVYAGFLLVAAGVMWLFWVKPAVTFLKRGRSDGD